MAIYNIVLHGRLLLTPARRWMILAMSYCYHRRKYFDFYLGMGTGVEPGFFGHYISY